MFLSPLPPSHHRRLLLCGVVGHPDRGAHAEARGEHRQRDPGGARGALSDETARPQRGRSARPGSRSRLAHAAPGRRLRRFPEDRGGDAVLDGPSRVRELGLGEDLYFGWEGGGGGGLAVRKQAVAARIGSESCKGSELRSPLLAFLSLSLRRFDPLRSAQGLLPRTRSPRSASGYARSGCARRGPRRHRPRCRARRRSASGRP